MKKQKFSEAQCNPQIGRRKERKAMKSLELESIFPSNFTNCIKNKV